MSSLLWMGYFEEKQNELLIVILLIFSKKWDKVKAVRFHFSPNQLYHWIKHYALAFYCPPLNK